MLKFEREDFSLKLNGYAVYLDGKRVGRIVQDDGFIYQPKGHYRDARFWGERYSTLAECKASLAA